MELNKVQIGRRIHDIRVERKETMEQFGEAISELTAGKSKSGKSNVSRWERGENLPNDITLEAIAQLGGKTVNQILYGDDYQTRIENIIRDSNLINYGNYKTYYEELTVRYFEKINYLYPTEEEVIRKYLDIVETNKTELTLNSMVDSLGNSIDAIDQHYQGFININMDDINKLNTEHLQELSDNINEAVEKQREIKTLLYNLDNND